MRALTLLVIFLVMGNIFSQAGNKVVIAGDFIGYQNSAAITYFAGYSMANIDYLDTIIGDSKGHFTIELSIDQPHIFFAICKQDSGFFHIPAIIVKPGEQHSITCKPTKNNNKSFQGSAPNMSVSGPNVSISGPNSEGQQLVTLLSGWGGNSGKYLKEWNLMKPETLIDSLNSKVERTILPAVKAFEAKKIDNDFYDLIKICIGYYNAYKLTTAINEILNKEEYSQQKDQLEKVNGEVFYKYPISNVYILNALNFDSYISLYIKYTERKNKEESDTFASEGLNVTYELSIAKKALSKEAYKFYAQNSIYQAARKSNKESLALLEQFKSEYPDYVQSKVYHLFEKQLLPAIKKLQVQ
jgi:hypothetical protein